jgi:hypothetical protein
LALLLALSRTSAPEHFKHQPKQAKADDKPKQQYRDFGLRMSLRRTFSCECRV